VADENRTPAKLTGTTRFEQDSRERPAWRNEKLSQSKIFDVSFGLRFTGPPSLHVSGADHTRRHSTSRSTDHRVSDMCDNLRSSTLGLLLLPRSLLLHDMSHLPHAHYETSKRDSPNEIKVKENKMKLSRIRIQTSLSQ
jgi:hypothetical protein